MSERYFYPGQFTCMYCKTDLDPEGTLGLAAGDNIDLPCSTCGAVWKFFTYVQLNLKLVKGGKYNKK